MTSAGNLQEGKANDRLGWLMAKPTTEIAEADWLQSELCAI
jgi:hypothetical protein